MVAQRKVFEAAYLTSDSGYRRYGCIKLDGSNYGGSGGVYTFDMSSTTACDSRRCPTCFMVNTVYRHVHMTMLNCDKSDADTAFSSSTLTKYEFINLGNHMLTIKDATSGSGSQEPRDYQVPGIGSRGAVMTCYCIVGLGGGSQLACDSSYQPIHAIGGQSSLGFGKNCAKVSQSSELTLQLNNVACANRYCPTCFVLDTTDNSVSIILQYCSYYGGVEQTTTALVQYSFVNIGVNKAYVGDNVRTYAINQQGYGGNYMNCVCYNSLLMCDAPTSRLKSAETVAYARFPEGISVNGPTRFGDGSQVNVADTYMRYTATSPSTPRVEFYIAASRSLQITGQTGGGGKLHGTWTADNSVTTSDRRLKTDISPLQETLLLSSAGKTPEVADGLSPAQRIISQLRPVSFRYLAFGDRRYGFLADEVEEVMPDLVITENDENRTKKLMLHDFIALLVSGVQSQQQVLETISRRGEERQNATAARLSFLEQELERMRTDVSQLKAQTGKCWTNCTNGMSQAESDKASTTAV